MRTEFVVALISLAGPVSGSLLTAYSAELKAILLGQFNRDKDLVGDWDCIWDIESPEKEPSIHDIVTFEKISAEKIRATAKTPGVGKYRLVGRISPSSLVTFFYEGLADRHPLGGVVILKLNPMRNEMKGKWHEYGPEGIVIGGSTCWTKGHRPKAS